MGDIGVKAGRLQLAEYNPEWARLGREMADTLKGIMKKAVDIRHVGSTAVPGLLSKPLIDIAVGVRNLEDILEYVDELEALDIHYSGEVVPGQREFYKDNPGTDERACHIHVVPYGEKNWNDYVNLVDYLCVNERARESYILLKKALLLMYEDRPHLYGPAKYQYLEDMKADARKWRMQNG